MSEARIDTLITNAKIVTHAKVIEGSIGIDKGKIVAISGAQEKPRDAVKVIDAAGKYLLPGAIDPHNHPGAYRPFSEDVRTETRAAAAGGVTTVNAVIKSTRMSREYKVMTEEADAISYLKAFPVGKKIVEDEALVDMSFTFAIMSDQQAAEIPQVFADCGVNTYKFYVGYRTASEFTRRIGLPLTWDDGTLYLGFENIGKIGGMALIHAENTEVSRILTERVMASGRKGLQQWDERSPDMTEALHISQCAHFALFTGARLYVVHNSSKLGLEEILAWQARGVNVVSETCPHYLLINYDMDPPGVAAKVNAPIRPQSDLDALWAGIHKGQVQCIGSDHVTGRKDDIVVAEDIWACWAGFTGVEQMLPLMLNEVSQGRIPITKVAEVCAYNTARHFGLYPRKGAIEVGADADLVLADMNKTQTVKVGEPQVWHSWSDFSVWEGRELKGWPVMTMVRGNVVYKDGEIVAAGGGQYVPRVASK